MLWDTKQDINKMYANNITNQFFLQELVEDMKDDETTSSIKEVEEYENNLPQMPHTSKYKLEQIESQLKNVVHDGFDYSDYSIKDGTNKRFMEKMEQNNSLRGSLFGNNDNEDNSYMSNKTLQKDLFGNEINDCPF